MDLIGKSLLENKDLLDRAYRRWPDTTLISVLMPQLSSFSELIEQINLYTKIHHFYFVLRYLKTEKFREKELKQVKFIIHEIIENGVNKLQKYFIALIYQLDEIFLDLLM